jgi:hypothetical protein
MVSKPLWPVTIETYPDLVQTIEGSGVLLTHISNFKKFNYPSTKKLRTFDVATLKLFVNAPGLIKSTLLFVKLKVNNAIGPQHNPALQTALPYLRGYL